MASGLSAERYARRQRAAQAAVAAARARALLIGVGPELEWLTGYAAHGIERLNLLVIPSAGPLTMISPRLEASAALAAAGISDRNMRVWTWEETEDPFGLVPETVRASSPGALLCSDGMRAAFVLGLQQVLGSASWGLASSLLTPMRRTKDAEEAALLREAAAAADRTIERVSSGPLVGRTEAQVARDVRDALVDEGHDIAEFWIVASGPNSASPHHEPGDRVIVAGEPVLFDIGGRLGGYCSDITRTVWVAGDQGIAPEPRFRQIYELVRVAQATARAAVRPGLGYGDLDAVAREAITGGGYGVQFIHRLGHGIGLEVHEAPYVVAGNDLSLAAGDVFSVEPGIYLEGRYGVRLEDIVMCTTEGSETLNQAPRDLRVVAGI